MNKKYAFNAKEETQNAINWIKNWFETKSGNAKGIVVGISGGKDSAVVASLCCEAIGKDRVFGVLMPNSVQKDINDSIEVCNHLGIRNVTIDIGEAYQTFCKNSVVSQIITSCKNSDLALINVAPRLRMTTLYFVAQSMNYRVAGTGNLSEATVGYFTKWGDGAHDFNPLANLTKTEVVEIAKELKLPVRLCEKAPSDGLSGRTDEESFGFTYEELDNYIRTGKCSSETLDKIIKMSTYGGHKLVSIPCFTPSTIFKENS